MEHKSWYVLSSRSGSTLNKIINGSALKPSAVYHTKDMSCAEIYEKINALPSNTVVTLMGYMHIVPKKICDRMTEMYNLHPAPIHIPGCEWLKGKDPIERFLNQFKVTPPNGYFFGSVIHKVTSKLDDGDVVASGIFTAMNKQDVYDYSFALNVELWKTFLKKKLSFEPIDLSSHKLPTLRNGK